MCFPSLITKVTRCPTMSGFRGFTHPQTVLKGRTFFNLSLREHPYSGKAGERKMKLLIWFER